MARGRTSDTRVSRGAGSCIGLSARCTSLVYWLGGLDPLPFHVVALTLHALNACLVSLIAAHLFGSRALG